MTRGIKNNNPLNIRNSSTVFNGEVTPSADKDFKQFQTLAHGYRAGFKILQTYKTKGVDSVEKIINRWAPANENNTNGYISFVCLKSGLQPTDKVNESNIKKLVYAMSWMENGTQPLLSVIDSGFDLLKKKA